MLPLSYHEFLIIELKHLAYKYITVSVAQPARPYPTPDSESTCQGLSESVVGFSGGAFFTRLDSGEQCCIYIHMQKILQCALT